MSRVSEKKELDARIERLHNLENEENIHTKVDLPVSIKALIKKYKEVHKNLVNRSINKDKVILMMMVHGIDYVEERISSMEQDIIKISKTKENAT